MTGNVVLVHGAWVTPSSWQRFASCFEPDFTVAAPAWPGKDRPVDAIRRDPSALAGLGVAEIVDHYAAVVERFAEPPVLIGHSFGGLFVQLLLDRGLGAAGVAIDSAPPRGVPVTQPSAVRALWPVLKNPANRGRVVRWSFEEFRYAFVHTMPEAQAREVYERHVVPETGRIFFQSAAAPLTRRSPLSVDFGNDDRAPLLLVAGEKDRIVPPAVNRTNHRKYRRSTAVTDFREYPGRTHWLIGDDGCEEIAGDVLEWLRKVGVAD